MRQTVKNRMIKNVQMMAVGMMATASIMGTAAAMGVKMDNIPFNVLTNPFQAVMTQGVAAVELGSSGSCGDNATYELSMDGTLTISGNGAITEGLGGKFAFNNNIKQVIINEGITEVGDNAFQGCSNLKKVQLPESLKTLNGYSFGMCNQLTEIYIPSGVEALSRLSFTQCSNLVKIQGMKNVNHITHGAFNAGGKYSSSNPLETTLETDNEYVLGYDWLNNESRKMNVESPVDPDEPLEPVKENWLYSSDDEAFITDKVQVGSVKDDFEFLLDEFATVVGLDEKQGAKQNYETADASNEDTLVYCTKASDWIITIPKDLVMSGDDESRAEYVVGVYGNVDPAKRVTVTPAPSFEMTNTGNAKVKYNAQVNQAVTGINGMDIIESPEADVDDASQMSGTITANLKRAGSYRGTMTFTVDYVDHT